MSDAKKEPTAADVLFGDMLSPKEPEKPPPQQTTTQTPAEGGVSDGANGSGAK